MTVVKRDGRSTKFDKTRIEKAVYEAAIATDWYPEDARDLADVISEDVAAKFESKEGVCVSEVQDAVEKRLMRSKANDVATNYITYRSNRDRVREAKSRLKTEIDGLFDHNNLDVTLENANKSAKVIPTQRDLVAGVVSKEYGLNHLLPKHIAKAHKEGWIHVHDLDYSPLFGSYNCQLGGFTKMLQNGFKMGNAELSQPRSIRTAATVLTQAIAQIASASYGGLTVNDTDRLLAPYVEKSYNRFLKDAKKYNIPNAEKYAKEKLEEDVYAAMQTVEYQINTLSTTNGQTPFTTLSFGLGTTYYEKLVQKSILKVRLKGLGENEVTPVFPKLCFILKKGHNLKPEDPHYEMKQLAMECQRKRVYPDLLNYDRVVEVTGNFKAPMG